MTDLSSALRPIVILEHIAAHPDGVSLRGLRDDLGIPRSSVWLVVKQLETGGFVSRSGDKFVPGARLLRMGLGLYQTATMGGEGRASLQSLSAAIGLDVYLAIRTGDSVVYADRIFGANSVQVRRQLGEPRSLHASAAGKLFLAYETDGLWDRCVAGQELKAFTPQTITDPSKLRAQLETIRALGYVDSEGEVLSSISSLGSMAFDSDGTPWAAVIISAHVSDLADRRDQLIPPLIETTKQLSAIRSALKPGQARR